jgi:hypothetical protein
LIETLAAFMFLPRQHPRPRFLLLMQALEGLYGHAHRADLAPRLEVHRELRQQARDAVQHCDALDVATTKFIRDNIPSRPAGSLETALRDALQSLPVNLTSEAASLSLIAAVIADQDNSANDWASALRVARNDLSHGTRSWDAKLLEPAADLLERVCRAHLMRVVGCPTPIIKDYLADHRPAPTV